MLGIKRTYSCELASKGSSGCPDRAGTLAAGSRHRTRVHRPRSHPCARANRSHSGNPAPSRSVSSVLAKLAVTGVCAQRLLIQQLLYIWMSANSRESCSGPYLHLERIPYRFLTHKRWFWSSGLSFPSQVPRTSVPDSSQAASCWKWYSHKIVALQRRLTITPQHGFTARASGV